MADDYASHYAVLAAAIRRTTGPVLEAGCGEGSTPMLHYMCKGNLSGRPLLTLDSDRTWLDKFAGYSQESWHLFEWVTDWSKHDLLGDAFFGVAFIDNAPGESRIKLIEKLAHRATFILAHDSERDWATGANYGYEKVRPLFKYVSEFRRWRPYTLILSNFEPFEIEQCDRKWIPTPEQQANYDKMGIKA